jgi:hypothetical protein
MLSLLFLFPRTPTLSHKGRGRIRELFCNSLWGLAKDRLVALALIVRTNGDEENLQHAQGTVTQWMNLLGQKWGMRPAKKKGERLAWCTGLRCPRGIGGDQFQFQRSSVRLESEGTAKQRAKIGARKLVQHFWLEG